MGYKFRALSLLLALCWSFCFSADFDVVIVGTSPICLLEALYRHDSGSRVLILEKAKECGGAWKSISVCGVPHADLGCHEIGTNLEIFQFLEAYAGCHFVSIDTDQISAFDRNSRQGNTYFSGGCYELVHNLVKLIEEANISLLLNNALESMILNTEEGIATIKTQDRQFTTSRVIITNHSDIKIENHPQQSFASQTSSKSYHYHLYLLIEDPSFHFFNGGTLKSGVIRMMNLTPFTELADQHLKLIVLQVQNESQFQIAATYVEELKMQGFISLSARLIASEPYIFEQAHSQRSLVDRFPHANSIVEILPADSFHQIISYIPKWKQVLKPLQERGVFYKN